MRERKRGKRQEDKKKEEKISAKRKRLQGGRLQKTITVQKRK